MCIRDRGKLDCCGHAFCFGCIRKWAEEVTNSCPLCKRSISELQRVGPEQPSNGTDTFQRLRVNGPTEERPDGLQDPCAWLPNAQGPGCRVRVDAEGLELRWRGSAVPPAVDTLSPLGTLRIGPPTSTVGPDRATMDPYGVYRRPLVGPSKNVGVLGEWIAPGLGLETACLTAWHAAEWGARFSRP